MDLKRLGGWETSGQATASGWGSAVDVDGVGSDLAAPAVDVDGALVTLKQYILFNLSKKKGKKLHLKLETR